MPWLRVFWTFFCEHLLCKDDTYLLVGDESVVSKAGKSSYGLDRFFSSLSGKAVPGLAFFTFSLVNVRTRSSSPLLAEQVVRSEAEKASAKAPPKRSRSMRKGKQSGQASRKRVGQGGRPKGSQNRNKQAIEWTPLLRLLAAMLAKVMPLFAGCLPVRYLVMDGQFGNNNTLQMVRQGSSLHLVSKLRADSALYFRYAGEQPKRGARRRYGDKLVYDALPAVYLKQTTTDKQVQTRIYQAVVLHKAFAQPLNVVILHKTNLNTQATAHVVLFSSDLDLPFDRLFDYYSLRFQIEFNFRDAKQFWGLEDFMNIKQTPVTNAVNLAFFMCLLSQRLLLDLRQSTPLAGILDLKAYFRSRRYFAQLLLLLPQYPDPFVIDQLLRHLVPLGSIHPSLADSTS
jgi:hypothetical protein